MLRIISKILVLLIFIVFLESKSEVYEKSSFKIIAHRGFPGYRSDERIEKGDFNSDKIMENSLNALIRAKKKNFDVLEFDIVMTKDENFVLSHDLNLERVTGENLDISDHNLKELKKIKLLDNQYITSLDDVFKEFRDSVLYDIELKNNALPTGFISFFSWAFNNLAEVNHKKIIKKIKEYNLENNVTLSCFNAEILKKIKIEEPSIQTSLLVADVFLMRDNIEERFDSKVDVVSLDDGLVTKQLIERLQKENFKIVVWTVNDKKRINILKNKFNVNGIMTDIILD